MFETGCKEITDGIIDSMDTIVDIMIRMQRVSKQWT